MLQICMGRGSHTVKVSKRANTRTEGLMLEIRARISAGILTPGGRLPSVRRFAAAMGASPSTVVEAYDRLEAEGIIRGRRGSGFYVTDAGLPPRTPTRMGIMEADAARTPEIDPFWVSKQSLDAEPSVLKPGCGWLPDDWMPVAALRRGLRTLARADGALLTEYGGTRGPLALRRLLLARFAEEGIGASLDQVMLTGSGTQAIDLVCRLVLQPGDAVLVDDPCYFNFQALLRAHPVRVVSVPMTPWGPEPEAFERVLEAETPRLYITNSALQNPTGATLSPQTAHRLLILAQTHGLTIVEDDIFADFEPAPSPRLAILDGLSRVIRIGSFSKTLSSAVRCGYIAARPEWIEALADLQIATSFGAVSPVAGELVAGILGGGGYRKHMDEVRHRLAYARIDVAGQLGRLGIVPWLMPRGGFYLWCRLPDGLDSASVAQRCRDEGVILAPGNVFSVAQSAGAFLRFNVAQMGDPRVLICLARAMG